MKKLIAIAAIILIGIVNSHPRHASHSSVAAERRHVPPNNHQNQRHSDGRKEKSQRHLNEQPHQRPIMRQHEHSKRHHRDEITIENHDNKVTQHHHKKRSHKSKEQAQMMKTEKITTTTQDQLKEEVLEVVIPGENSNNKIEKQILYNLVQEDVMKQEEETVENNIIQETVYDASNGLPSSHDLIN